MSTRYGIDMTLDEAWQDLHSDNPSTRVRASRWLAGPAARAQIAAVGDAGVWELTRTADYRTVAERLGVSAAAVNKAVTRHLRREWDSTVGC